MQVVPRSETAGRPGAAALGTVLIGLSGWLIVHNLRHDGLEVWIFWLPIALWLLTMGLLCWWAVLGVGQPATRARIGTSWRWGWIVGATGLALGYFVPLLVRPSASLGPLLGILITGPGGFVLGALAGALRVKLQPPGGRLEQ
jgi:hypothetical protein